jgi:hypothetical protein
VQSTAVSGTADTMSAMSETFGCGKEGANALIAKNPGVSAAGGGWYGADKLWSRPAGKGGFGMKLEEQHCRLNMDFLFWFWFPLCFLFLFLFLSPLSLFPLLLLSPLSCSLPRWTFGTKRRVGTHDGVGRYGGPWGKRGKILKPWHHEQIAVVGTHE